MFKPWSPGGPIDPWIATNTTQRNKALNAWNTPGLSRPKRIRNWRSWGMSWCCRPDLYSDTQSADDLPTNRTGVSGVTCYDPRHFFSIFFYSFQRTDLRIWTFHRHWHFFPMPLLTSSESWSPSNLFGHGCGPESVPKASSHPIRVGCWFSRCVVPDRSKTIQNPFPEPRRRTGPWRAYLWRAWGFGSPSGLVTLWS